MRKEQKDIAGLGSFEILLEGLKLYRAHAKVFLLIQLTLMLPLAIVLSGLEFLAISNLPVPPNLHGRSPGGAHVPHPLRVFRLSDSSDADPAGSMLDALLMVLASFPVALVFQAALSLAQSTSLYSVGLHYSGHPIAYLDVLRAAMPRLWMRMAVTNTWYCVTTFFLSLIQVSFPFILISSQVPMVWLSLATMAASILVSLANLYIAMIFMVTSGVSVLEEDYGWAAVRKSLKLLKGKMKVAFWFQILYFVPVGLIEGGILLYLVPEWKKEEFSAWDVTQLVLITVVYVAVLTFIWQVQFLCSGVQYVSFKAYHDESLTDPLLENQKQKDGYVAIGDGENEAGNNV